MFPIRMVDRQWSEQAEYLGTKFKFWFRDDGVRRMFKAEERGTGEDWAEVVVCHLCRRLGLPHVEYELAEEYVNGQYIRPGTVCDNMAEGRLSLVLGNELLLVMDATYPAKQRRKVRAYTVEAVARLVRLLGLPLGFDPAKILAGTATALDVFVGYMLLDAWVANQDRHHENWGALERDGAYYLAPTFDHGASLARNETDETRLARLTTKDEGFSVATYAAKAKTPFFGASPPGAALTTMEVYRAFAQEAPPAALVWESVLRDISEAEIQAILDQVPNKRMSSVAKQFTLKLLSVNRERILEGT